MIRKILSLLLVFSLMISPVSALAEEFVPEGDIPEISADVENESAEEELIPEEIIPEEEFVPEEEIIPEEESVPEEESAQEDLVPEEPQEQFPEDSEEKPIPNEEETIPQETTEESEEAVSFMLLEEKSSPWPGTEESFGSFGHAVTQTYITQAGEEHTIYWTKGMNPPSMTGNGSHSVHYSLYEGTTVGGDYTAYSNWTVPYEPGNGYYDLNKPGDRSGDNRCYLGAASNILYWWMDQNRANIDWYLDQIAQGRFQQPVGLADITQAPWSELRQAPGMEVGPSRFSQQLLDSASLVNGPFRTNYKVRKNGYYMDLVQDFFLNGYKAMWGDDNSEPQGANSPDRYYMDKNGGYFYPVFGTNMLTRRYDWTAFDYYETNLKQWLSDGKGVTIGYYTMGGKAHAITLWGAEYSGDTLVRVYVTDTDDMYDTAPPDAPDASQGLKGINTLNSGGSLYLSNDETGKAQNGTLINLACTLDLGTSYWEALKKDSGVRPEPPTVVTNPESRDYHAKDQAEPMYAEGRKGPEDQQAVLSYQWYEAQDETGAGAQPISGQTRSSYIPSLQKGEGTRYYFCRISVQRNGWVSTADTSVAAISVVADDADVINAQKPAVVVRGYNTPGAAAKLNQKDTFSLKVDASSPDQGELSYQWYRVDSNTTVNNRWEIPGADGPELAIPTEQYGRTFYQCRVTNKVPHANGRKQASRDSNIVNVIVYPEPLQITVPDVISVGQQFTPGFLPEYADNDRDDIEGKITWQVSGCGSLQPDGTILVTGPGTLRISLQRYYMNMPSSYAPQKATLEVTVGRQSPEVNNVSYSGKLTEGMDVSELVLTHTGTPGTVKLKPGTVLQAGTHEYEWVFTPADPEQFTGKTGTVSLTVSPAEKTVVSISAQGSKDAYDGKPHKGYGTVVTQPQWSGELEASYQKADGTVLEGPPTQAGDYVVTLKIPESDGAYTGIHAVPFTIAKRNLTIESAAAEPKVYDGTQDVVISKVEFSNLAEWETLQKDRDYRVSAEFDTADAGTGKRLTVTVQLEPEITNYVIKSGSITLNNQEILKAPIENIITEVPAPEVGAVPDASLSGEHFQADILWEPADPTFRQGVAYKAVLTIRADGNHYFTEKTTVNDQPAVYDGEQEALSWEVSFQPLAGDRVEVTHLQPADTLWVDGVEVMVTKEGDRQYITLPDSQSQTVVSYEFKEPVDGDIHTSYPTGMKVSRIVMENGVTRIVPVPELDDLLSYRGMSIRLKGKQGIRMITGIDSQKKADLIHNGLAGYKLVEYGTVVAWAENLGGDSQLVLDGPNAKHNSAYNRATGSDPIFAIKGNDIQYTNVLVGFTLDQCIPDFAMRPYAILEDGNGVQFPVYGGILYRSIGYVAYQNKDKFPEGSAAHDFVWQIIEHVEKNTGNQPERN